MPGTASSCGTAMALSIAPRPPPPILTIFSVTMRLPPFLPSQQSLPHENRNSSNCCAMPFAPVSSLGDFVDSAGHRFIDNEVQRVDAGHS